MDKKVRENAVKRTVEFFKGAHIVITPAEIERIEVADFGMNNLDNIGLEILTYVNTERVCAKEMVLFPYQTCPQHRHVESYGKQGKEETFRVRKGVVYLYVNGEKTPFHGKMPDTEVNVFHEIVLNEGEQYTIMPGTEHWFQSGADGAVVSEFSTRSTDETDVFFDKKIVR